MPSQAILMPDAEGKMGTPVYGVLCIFKVCVLLPEHSSVEELLENWAKNVQHCFHFKYIIYTKNRANCSFTFPALMEENLQSFQHL